MFEILMYDTEDGRCPVQEFLDSLDCKLRMKTVRTIELLEHNGTLLREPYSKSIGEGILELRVCQGNNISRVLYFFVKGNKIILTNGFIKKTSKTPIREKELAIKYRADYLRRFNNDKI